VDKIQKTKEWRDCHKRDAEFNLAGGKCENAGLYVGVVNRGLERPMMCQEKKRGGVAGKTHRVETRRDPEAKRWILPETSRIGLRAVTQKKNTRILSFWEGGEGAKRKGLRARRGGTAEKGGGDARTLPQKNACLGGGSGWKKGRTYFRKKKGPETKTTGGGKKRGDVHSLLRGNELGTNKKEKNEIGWLGRETVRLRGETFHFGGGEVLKKIHQRV